MLILNGIEVPKRKFVGVSHSNQRSTSFLFKLALLKLFQSTFENRNITLLDRSLEKLKNIASKLRTQVLFEGTTVLVFAPIHVIDHS